MRGTGVQSPHCTSRRLSGRTADSAVVLQKQHTNRGLIGIPIPSEQTQTYLAGLLDNNASVFEQQLRHVVLAVRQRIPQHGLVILQYTQQK